MSQYFTKLFAPGWWKSAIIGFIVMAMVLIVVFNLFTIVSDDKLFSLHEFTDDYFEFFFLVTLWLFLGAFCGLEARRQYHIHIDCFTAAHPELSHEYNQKFGRESFFIKLSKQSWYIVALFPILVFAFAQRLPKSFVDFILILFTELLALWLFRISKRDDQ